MTIHELLHMYDQHASSHQHLLAYMAASAKPKYICHAKGHVWILLFILWYAEVILRAPSWL